MPVDLRSDTVTQPTDAMRKAMAAAEVGDDVYGEDPNVNRLEEMAAERVGMAAAVYVPSGTMGNCMALLAHCQRGDEIFLDPRSHIMSSEAGGPGVIAGVWPNPLPVERGQFTAAALAAAIRGPNVHYPRPRLVCIENTSNNGGGSVWPLARIAEVSRVAHERGLMVHMDGARVFNAAVALGVSVAEICKPVDSLMFCVSKGLGAPVGSLLCGPAEFIARARHARKMLGGGMRQAGILAAAGIVALETMVERLAEDHENARRLGAGLADLRGVRVQPVETNFVMVDFSATGVAPGDVVAGMRARGVLCSAAGTRMRLVTHKDVDRGGIDLALRAFAEVLR
jgi:threonine aldolase